MGIEIQFCIKENSDRRDRSTVLCPECGEGVLYYPSLDASDIGGNMETVKVACRCTSCDDYSDYNNTAPRYLTWRVVVSV